MKSVRWIVLKIVVLMIVSVVFSPSLRLGFVWDDWDYILTRSKDKQVSWESVLLDQQPVANTKIYRPARNIFYPLLYGVIKDWAQAYHLTVLALHLANVWLVMELMSNIGLKKSTAWLAGVFFGLHPIHVESVAWITAGIDLLPVMFFLSCVNFYLKDRKSGQGQNMRWAFLFGSMAIFGSEIASVLPVILLFFELTILKEKKVLVGKVLPFVIITVIYWFVRTSVLGLVGRMDGLLGGGWQQLLLSFLVIGKYMMLFLWPVNLSINHSFGENISGLFYLDHNPLEMTRSLSVYDFDVLVSLVSILIFLVVGVVTYKKKLMKISLFIGWLFISLLPVAQIVAQPIIFAERYAYLASVGFVGCLIILIERVGENHKKAMVVLLFLIVMLYSLRSVSRIGVWRDDLSLWGLELVKNPESAAILNGLGTGYYQQGEYKKASDYFEKAQSENPKIKNYKINLVATYEKLGNYREAVEIFEEIGGNDLTSQIRLTEMYFKAGRKDRARALLEMLFQQYPDNQRLIDLDLKINQTGLVY